MIYHFRRNDCMNEPKPLLPLLVTKNFIVYPDDKEQKIDAARGFSRAAIDASIAHSDSLILIVSQTNGEIESPSTEELYTVGTWCRITSYRDLKNYISVKVVGLSRVKLTNITFDTSLGYFVANYDLLEDINTNQAGVIDVSRQIVSYFQKDAQLLNSLPNAIRSELLSSGIEPGKLCDLIAQYIPMTNADRQQILEKVDVLERCEFVYHLLLNKTMEKQIDKEIQEDVAKSSEKAQRDYILNEKLKAIKKELGEDPNDQNSENGIRERLEKNPYPEHVKNKVKAELRRYEMMPQASLESSLIMSYIQTLMDVPWYQTTKDNDDLENVQKILDEDHYGLDKVKKRIVEYLAVKKMTGSLKAPILCFYGPPGCGKTSLASSIARALGRKFFKASLGGISDEAEIRGHRRTYVGSMPGRIINGMKRVGVTNPVFLLDEVDKLASSYKGDPASALLEVLDPAQNFQFNDNYLEEPYDLSNVLFIATANYLENVPAPLRDRLELIEVNSYTEFEKIKIAQNHLIKKELAANGLSPEQVSISEDAIKLLIEKYTREAGVRELQRLIGSLLRKSVVEILTKKVEHIDIDEAKAIEYLGAPIFENSKKEVNEQVGVVTGLAYTQYGGDILPIEVTYFPGKGALSLTGKLGDVMKESATIALDYVKSNAEKYKIDNSLFEKNDIHIHFPEGAVPKDGPSAGVAITTAIISCFTNRKVDNNVAMTGEVNLRGNALPIGGLREKSLAALRSGIKTIIVPKDNAKDVNELPEEAKNGLNIILMEKVDDALAVALKQ